MTNGEKFQQIFAVSQVDECDLNVYAWLPCHDAIEIPLEWWNTNYSEIPTGSTTKNDLGVDAVSRKDVHDMLENLPVTVENKWFNWLQKACMRLAELPSVTPQEPRWIPCSEKKPNKGGEYLLWGKIDESEEEDYCFIGDYYEFDEVFGTEISNYDPKTLGFIDTEIEEYYSVVAWMPLPKPYKAESENP